MVDGAVMCFYGWSTGVFLTVVSWSQEVHLGAEVWGVQVKRQSCCHLWVQVWTLGLQLQTETRLWSDQRERTWQETCSVLLFCCTLLSCAEDRAAGGACEMTFRTCILAWVRIYVRRNSIKVQSDCSWYQSHTLTDCFCYNNKLYNQITASIHL